MFDNSRVMGYFDQDWSATTLEINQRVKRLMDGNHLLSYADALQTVMLDDPSLADKVWSEVQAEVVKRVKQTMLDHSNLDYAAALRTVMQDDSGLAHRYEASRKAALGYSGRSVEDPAADVEINGLVKAKIAASEAGNYGVALSMVLNERPDLARRKKDSMRPGMDHRRQDSV